HRAVRGERRRRGPRLGHAIIEDRGFRLVGTLRAAQHQPRLAALEEGEARGCVEQMRESQRLAIESLGPIQVLNGYCDLHDMRRAYGHGFILPLMLIIEKI